MGPDSQETPNNQESDECAAVFELGGNMFGKKVVDSL